MFAARLELSSGWLAGNCAAGSSFLERARGGCAWLSTFARNSDSQKAQSPLWPEHALIGSHHIADALVDEFLKAFALPGFGRIDVALGISRDAVHTVELAGLTTAVTE